MAFFANLCRATCCLCAVYVVSPKYTRPNSDRRLEIFDELYFTKRKQKSGFKSEHFLLNYYLNFKCRQSFFMIMFYR